MNESPGRIFAESTLGNVKIHCPSLSPGVVWVTGQMSASIRYMYVFDNCDGKMKRICGGSTDVGPCGFIDIICDASESWMWSMSNHCDANCWRLILGFISAITSYWLYNTNDTN